MADPSNVPDPSSPAARTERARGAAGTTRAGAVPVHGDPSPRQSHPSASPVHGAALCYQQPEGSCALSKGYTHPRTGTVWKIRP